MANIEHYIDKLGINRWKLNGVPHREDGPAIIYPSGAYTWFRHGKYHREDGPAIVLEDDTQMWWSNGNLHRKGGPAVSYPDGRVEWWYTGLEYSFDEYCNELALSDEQCLELKVKYM